MSAAYSSSSSIAPIQNSGFSGIDNLKNSIADTAALAANGYGNNPNSEAATTTSFSEENQQNNNMGYQDMLDDITRISQIVGKFFYTPINVIDEMMKRFVRKYLTVTHAEKVGEVTNSHRVQPTKKNG